MRECCHPRPALAFGAMFVRELADGDEIDQVLVVREAELRRRSDGSEFLRLSVADRSGSVVAVAGATSCTRATAPRSRWPTPGRPSRGKTTSTGCSTARRARSRAWRPRCAT
jgi:hypothetical protein